MYPSRKKALEMRILDLKSRVEELNSLIEAQSDWVVSGFEELRFSQEEITAVAPQDFYTFRELQRAIDLAEEELLALDDE